MTVLTSEFQTIASWNDATHRVYLRARYRTSTVSGNSAHVLYQLLVNVNTQQSATSVNNAWALNGTGATSQSSSGGTFTLSGGDNVIAEIESGAITGGSNVSISGGYYMGYYNWGSTSLSGSATLPTFGGAPTDLSVSNITPGYDTVTATVSVSGWGGLGDATSRYRELNVWAYDTGVSGGYRRYQKTYGDSLSSSITTNNSSEVQGSMDIVPNTRYILTTYASNGTYNTGQINSTNIVTLAAPATISLSSVTSSSATFNYTTGADGGVYTKTIEYSVDGGTTWNTGVTISSGSASSGAFTVSGLDPSTAYVFKTRVSTTAGNTSNSDISFSTEGGFYGSVNGDAELVEKMYGPVNVVGDLQLKGDTTQQTYTGKNLFLVPSTIPGTTVLVKTKLTDNSFQSVWDKTTSSTTTTVLSEIDVSGLLPNTAYVLSYDAEITGYVSSRTGQARLSLEGQWTSTYSTDNKLAFTTGNTGATKIGFYNSAGGAQSGSQTVVWSNIQVEAGSTPTAFEPYVGGVPAPNPDYPQTVNTVTGRQTIDIALPTSTEVISNQAIFYVDVKRLPKTFTLKFDSSVATDSSISMRIATDTGTNYVSPGSYDIVAGTNEMQVTLSDNNYATIQASTGDRIYFQRNGFFDGATVDNASIIRGRYEINLGKNLFDNSQLTVVRSSQCDISTISTGVRVSSTRTTQPSSGAYDFSAVKVLDANDYIGKTLTLSVGDVELHSSNRLRLIAQAMDSNGDNRETLTDISQANSSGSFTITNAHKNKIITITPYVGVAGDFQVGAYIDYKDLQLEVGSTATSYAPYFTPIELCKLGTYQDYIYRSGGNWYLHKEIDKYTFDGSESWLSSPYGTNSWALNNVLYFTFDTNKIQIMSNIANGIAHTDRNTAGPNVMYSGQNNSFTFRNTSFTTLSAVQTATQNNYVYYALATATDTQITNAALIAQLDALGSSSTYGQDTIITVEGSLPAEVSANMVSAKEIIKLYGSVNGLTKRVL